MSIYDDLQERAYQILTEYGTSSLLYRADGGEVDPTKPWRGKTEDATPLTVQALLTSVTKEDISKMEGVSIHKVRKAIIEGKAFTHPDEPKVDDVLLFEGVRYPIVAVDPKRPTDIPLVFSCVVAI